jgi:hypothetical protein
VRDLRGVLERLREDLKLEDPHIEVLDTRAYLRSTLDYVLRQAAQHGLVDVHPALWTGSCFPDLIGLRRLPGFDPDAIRRELQRLQLRELFPVVGLPVVPIGLASDDDVRRPGVARLAELTTASLGVGPNLIGRDARTVRARRVVARLATRLGMRLSDLAPYLGVGVRALQLLASKGPDDPLAERAIRGRLTLENRISGRAAG